MKAATCGTAGRPAEGLVTTGTRKREYKTAIDSPDRAAAAEARLLDIMLRQRRDELNQADALRELETLAVTWRGDAIEVRVLQMMAKIYTDTERYGESLAAARTATRLSRIRNFRGPVRMRRRRCFPSSISVRRATVFVRSTRSGCFTSIAN